MQSAPVNDKVQCKVEWDGSGQHHMQSGRGSACCKSDPSVIAVRCKVHSSCCNDARHNTRPDGRHDGEAYACISFQQGNATDDGAAATGDG